ncbi:MAG: hypothetical protein PHX08_08865 [Lachnospiraceae bacterium]|nr:hypothetical protein [Lachnospiraceae bacterium]
MIQQITTLWYSAQYTMPLYQILEEYASVTLGIPLEEVHKLKPSVIIENSYAMLFDFDYTLWNQEYKKVLETNFCSYFYTREIGSETLNLFKQRLESEMVIKMPYYSQLYDSTEWMVRYKINPLDNTDYTETYVRKNTGESESDTKANTKSKNEGYNDAVSSDTPQGMLSGLDYATSANKSKAVTDNTSGTEQGTKGKDNSKEEYDYRKHGNIGVQTFADVLMSNRNAFINVDSLLFTDLTQLFMLVY